MNKNCRDPFDTTQFTVWYGYYLVAGMVFGGMGMVWENPTHGLPILNPTGSTQALFTMMRTPHLMTGRCSRAMDDTDALVWHQINCFWIRLLMVCIAKGSNLN